MPDEKDKIIVHNKVSPNYRSMHVDGAFGGITTRGYISLSFYAERNAIPKTTEFNVVENKLEKLRDTGGLTGILREFEAGIYMDLNAAKELKKFLDDRITELENLIQTSK